MAITTGQFPEALERRAKKVPINKYDEYFGGEENSADKAMSAMMKKYGKEKGKQVFHAAINKKKMEQKKGSNRSLHPGPMRMN